MSKKLIDFIIDFLDAMNFHPVYNFRAASEA